MLRQCERWQPGTSQLRFLVTWAFSDLEESAGRQNAFHLLKASWQRGGAGAGFAVPLLHVGRSATAGLLAQPRGCVCCCTAALTRPRTHTHFSITTTSTELQAILSRKLVLPEVYDLMNRVQARGSGVLGSCTRLHEGDAGVLHPVGLPAFTFLTGSPPCLPGCLPARPSAHLPA